MKKIALLSFSLLAPLHANDDKTSRWNSKTATAIKGTTSLTFGLGSLYMGIKSFRLGNKILAANIPHHLSLATNVVEGFGRLAISIPLYTTGLSTSLLGSIGTYYGANQLLKLKEESQQRKS